MFSALIEFLTTAVWFWVLLLVLWVVWWYSERSFPHIYREYDKKVNRVGDLCWGGSKATSKPEDAVRESLHAMGFRSLPPSLKLVVVDHEKKKRTLTPDIMLWRERVIVEVDPRYTHGGLSRITEDYDRNICYTLAGWKVVRVRIGWGTEADAEGRRGVRPYGYLDRHNDLVILGEEYAHERHSRELAKRINGARKPEVREFIRQYDQLTAIAAAGGFQ